MKKHSNTILIISTSLIVLGVIIGSFLTEYSNTISTIVTTVTAIIGAVALWIQFKKDKQINEASFIVEFYQSFYEQESNVKVLNELDKKYSEEKYTSLKTMSADVLNYLTWIRTLCDLIDRKVLSYESIDEIYSYKFFMILNNKEVQEMEIHKYANLYKLIYKTHNGWTKYHKKKGLAILMADEDLSLVEGYEDLCK